MVQFFVPFQCPQSDRARECAHAAVASGCRQARQPGAQQPGNGKVEGGKEQGGLDRDLGLGTSSTMQSMERVPRVIFSSRSQCVTSIFSIPNRHFPPLRHAGNEGAHQVITFECRGSLKGRQGLCHDSENPGFGRGFL